MRAASRATLRGFAILAYLGFLATIGAFVGLVTGLLPGRPPTPEGTALAIDASLILAFGVSHSVMARPWFKRAWTRVVPTQAERSVYVFVAAVALGLLVWQWRPVAGPPLWTLPAAGRDALLGLALAGFGFALVSTFLIDYLGLYGLRQAFEARPLPAGFRTPLFYRVVRHPQYLGILVALWAMPDPTVDHLALAVGLTLYILVGARLEERVLVDELGPAYARYRREVRALIPIPRRRPPA